MFLPDCAAPARVLGEVMLEAGLVTELRYEVALVIFQPLNLSAGTQQRSCVFQLVLCSTLQTAVWDVVSTAKLLVKLNPSSLALHLKILLVQPRAPFELFT